MKNLLPLIFLFSTTLCISQTKVQSYERERISAYTADRDTLWLVNREIGRLIAYSWEAYDDGTPKPVIVLVDKLPESKNYIVEAKYTRAPKRRRNN